MMTFKWNLQSIIIKLLILYKGFYFRVSRFLQRVNLVFSRHEILWQDNEVDNGDWRAGALVWFDLMYGRRKRNDQLLSCGSRKGNAFQMYLYGE